MDPSTTTLPGFALHLVVDSVDRSITWYEEALGASVTRVLRLPDGTVAIADLDVHGLPVAVAAAVPGTTLASPASSGTSVAAYRLTVEDAEAAMDQARAGGATVGAEVHDTFWGVRTGEVLDPSGHRWAFDEHLEDVPVAEIESRLAELLTSH